MNAKDLLGITLPFFMLRLWPLPENSIALIAKRIYLLSALELCYNMGDYPPK